MLRVNRMLRISNFMKISCENSEIFWSKEKGKSKNCHLKFLEFDVMAQLKQEDSRKIEKN